MGQPDRTEMSKMRWICGFTVKKNAEQREQLGRDPARLATRKTDWDDMDIGYVNMTLSGRNVVKNAGSMNQRERGLPMQTCDGDRWHEELDSTLRRHTGSQQTGRKSTSKKLTQVYLENGCELLERLQSLSRLHQCTFQLTERGFLQAWCPSCCPGNRVKSRKRNTD